MWRPGRGQLVAGELRRLVVERRVLLYVRLVVCEFLFFLRRTGNVATHVVVLRR
jgi:hypothetical protein